MLCNESFAATNEREGSEVAGEVIHAMTEAVAPSCSSPTSMSLPGSAVRPQDSDEILFLRADRDPEGRRSFQLLEGMPLATSHGADLYRQVFGPEHVTAPA